MKYLFFLLSFTVISGCTKPSNDSEVRIGEFGSLTGSEGAYGTDTHQGILLAIKEVNDQGGLFGKKVRLITYDNQGKTDEAVSSVTRLITQDQVHAIIGEVASTRSIAAGAIAQQYGVPMISPASTSEELTKVGNYIFRVCFVDSFQGEAMARFAAQNLKLKTGAILSDQKSDYSVGLAKHFEESFQAQNGKIVSKVTYSSGDIDFKSQLVAIRKVGADFLFLPGYYTEVGLIARQARELGYKGVFLGGDGWDSERLTEIGGGALAKSYFVNHYASDQEKSSKFFAAYQKEFQRVPNSSVALGYDAARLTLESIRRAGKLDRPLIREMIATTQNFQGVTGKFSISPQREVVKPAVVLQVAPNLTFTYFAAVK